MSTSFLSWQAHLVAMGRYDGRMTRVTYASAHGMETGIGRGVILVRTEGGPAPHVFILAGPKRQGALQYFEVVTLQTAGATLRGETEVGRTPDMIVYSDGSADG